MAGDPYDGCARRNVIAHDVPAHTVAWSQIAIEERLSRIEEQLRVIADAMKTMPQRQSVPDVTPYVPKPSEPAKQTIGECDCVYGQCVHVFRTIGEDVKKRSEPVYRSMPGGCKWCGLPGLHACLGGGPIQRMRA